MSYKDFYNEWLSSSYFDEDIKKELLLIKDDEKEIEDRFYRDLEFGTAGLRGIVEAGTNRMNIYTVRRCSYGLAKYFLQKEVDASKRGIIIAHDNRNMSREFCMEAAKTIAATGIKVYYFDDLRTTPMLSFSVRHLNCVGGIVITASHNPPKYNGYKVYGDNGAQVMPEVANDILNEIEKISDFSIIPKYTKENEDDLILLDSKIDDAFIKAVEENLIRREVIEKYAKNFKVVYTPLCGTGLMPVTRVLKDCGFENVFVVPEEEYPDPNFAGIKTPNPEEAVALKRGIDLLKKEDADILIANDPDCDRVGVAVKNSAGEVVLLTGNQIGGLLCEYVLSGLKEKNNLPDNACIIKTVVTSELGADIAKSLEVDVVNILTGFKFIGDKMTQYEKNNLHTFVMGYEESYGYLVGNQCRDKDAVVATLLISEMALYYRSKGLTLYEALIELYNKYGYYREKTISIALEGIEGSKKINRIMDTARIQELKSINSINVVECIDFKDGYMDFPKSNVLKYVLEDGSWVALRPSGTEPKLKIYVGTHDKLDEVASEKLNTLEKYFLNFVNIIE